MGERLEVSERDAIHIGIVLGLGKTRSLEIWRELGGKIRDTAWSESWDREVEAFKLWRSQRHS